MTSWNWTVRIGTFRPRQFTSCSWGPPSILSNG